MGIKYGEKQNLGNACPPVTFELVVVEKSDESKQMHFSANITLSSAGLIWGRRGVRFLEKQRNRIPMCREDSVRL